MDERAEKGTPFIFIKPQSAVTGPFEPVVVPSGAVKPDWELELAAVMGRRARRVSRERALDYVAGYTVVNDVVSTTNVQEVKNDGTNAIVTGLNAGATIVSNVDEASVGNGDRVDTGATPGPATGAARKHK